MDHFLSGVLAYFPSGATTIEMVCGDKAMAIIPEAFRIVSGREACAEKRFLKFFENSRLGHRVEALRRFGHDSNRSETSKLVTGGQE